METIQIRLDHGSEAVERQIEDAASLRDIDVGDGPLHSKVAAFIKGSMGADSVPGRADRMMIESYSLRFDRIHQLIRKWCSRDGIKWNETNNLEMDLALYAHEHRLEMRGPLRKP